MNEKTKGLGRCVEGRRGWWEGLWLVDKGAMAGSIDTVCVVG